MSLGFKSNPDYVGAMASGLCMVHCLATPFIFAAHATASLSCADISPLWWKLIDYLFLIISFCAIHFSSKSSSSKWIPKTLYVLWVCLAILVVNSSFHFIPLPHALLYIPALGLSALHLYNQRYCKCEDLIECAN